MVLEVLAGETFSLLLGGVASLLKEQVDLVLGAKDDLKELQKTLQYFQKKMRGIDCKPFLSSERNMYLEGEFKDVLYDAEDIIEEYQTKIERTKREEDSVNKVRKPWIPLCSCFKKHVSFPYELANKIKGINQRLDAIKNNKEMMDLLEPTRNASGNNRGERDDPRETTRYILGQPPIGREDDKRKVNELLFGGSSAEGSSVPRKDGGVSIVCIVGQGGIGKTTLAKTVFAAAEERFEERRWWVCVSQKPGLKSLLRKILKQVCKGSQRQPDQEINSLELDDLYARLNSELSGSKFLLVLDDVWELEGWWREKVEGILRMAAMGSKILVTSRNEEVSNSMGAKMYKLPKMPFTDSWNLFLEKAQTEEKELESHGLVDIANKIVDKCGGLPLVVQTVGCLMPSKKMKIDKWERVEKSEIWEWKSSSSQYGDILPGLILSYDDLPHHYLKSCFVYCCVYPKDYEVAKDELVMQWVAHGMVEQKKGIDVEETVKEYIDDLISRCLIENAHYEERVKMHDILHDLALYIGGNGYSHVSPTEHTRHLSLLDVNNPEVHKDGVSGAASHKWRTLLGKGQLHSVRNAPFTHFKCLRVLSLTGPGIKVLPDSIEHLILLKYLDLSSSALTKLPGSIGKLCNLQTLNLNNSRIKEMPNEIGELCNLRYLGLRDTYLKFIPKGLGRLTNLRTLERFPVRNNEVGETCGCNIVELRGLKKLKGYLSIEGLGNGMVEAIDAEKAQLVLKDKTGLTALKLCFNKQDHVGASKHKDVLEVLEPPNGLQELHIYDYEGHAPAWYLQVTNDVRLRRLELSNCPLWCEIPSMPSLKCLEICRCDGLTKLANIPALEKLNVRQCGGLEQITGMPDLKSLEVAGCGWLEQVTNMPALEMLHLHDLNTLKQLPAHLPSLEKLTVWNVRNWEG